jgi:hypothetical protein
MKHPLATFLLWFLSLLLAGRSGLAAGNGEPAAKPAEPGYIRFVTQGKDGGRLEAAVVTFEKKDLRVHLVAAVHVADKAYYEELNRIFEKYDALLYEMVKPREVEPDDPGKSQSLISIFQRGLKDTLGLEFQLDAVDYSRKNFVHADLDSETFQKLQLERGENLFTLMLRALLDDLRRKGQGKDSAELNGFDLLTVFLSRDRSRSFKLLLARQFKDIEGRLAGMEGERGSVILTERNKAALEVLKRTIRQGKKDIGIFYGGAHMPDLERRLKEELGFERKATRWLVAWDIPAPKE